jgi:hypothetical protein
MGKELAEIYGKLQMSTSMSRQANDEWDLFMDGRSVQIHTTAAPRSTRRGTRLRGYHDNRQATAQRARARGTPAGTERRVGPDSDSRSLQLLARKGATGGHRPASPASGWTRRNGRFRGPQAAHAELELRAAGQGTGTVVKAWRRVGSHLHQPQNLTGNRLDSAEVWRLVDYRILAVTTKPACGRFKLQSRCTAGPRPSGCVQLEIESGCGSCGVDSPTGARLRMAGRVRVSPLLRCLVSCPPPRGPGHTGFYAWHESRRCSHLRRAGGEIMRPARPGQCIAASSCVRPSSAKRCGMVALVFALVPVSHFG